MTTNGLGPPPRRAHSIPHDREDADDRIVALLGGPVTAATSDLLWTAARGSHALIDILVTAGLDLGGLTLHDGQWRWDAQNSVTARLAGLIKSHAARMVDTQLDALATLTKPLTEPHVTVRQVRHANANNIRLTPRELDVLGLLCQALTAAAMARRLGLSPKTVTKHLEQLYRKLGTSDRLSTVLRAQQLAIVTTPW